MNLGHLKKAIRDLGFEENTTIDDYKSIVATSITRAQETIALDVLPIIGAYKIGRGRGDDTIKYNFLELTKEDDLEKFYCFSTEEKPIDINTNEKFTDYTIHGRDTVLINPNAIGEWEFYYHRIPTPITEDTSDDFVIELDQTVHILLPLLSSYYIWLDDDERKATSYFNRYEELKDRIVDKNKKPTATIIGGF